MSGAYAAAVAGDETCVTPKPVTHQNPMRSTSADRPEAQRDPGVWTGVDPGRADPGRADPGRAANEDDRGEDGHGGVHVARGGLQRAWPSRKRPWWRRWRSPTRHRRQDRSVGMPGSPQRHRVRRGGRRDRSPPPAPPAGAGSHQRPTGPPAGLDRDACCRSSCHSQGGHAADFPRLSSGAQGRVKKASAAVPAARGIHAEPTADSARRLPHLA